MQQLLQEQRGARLLKMDELKPEKGIPYSRPHLYRLIKAGRFPRPVRLGTGDGAAIAFIESEIDDYIASLIAARDAEPAAA